MEYSENTALISEDVRLQYEKHRKRGCPRGDAIALVREEYNGELHDDDDRIAVLGGLVQGLYKKHELLETLADETRTEIQRIKQNCLCSEDIHKYITEIEKKLNDANAYGKEAPYKQASVYRPDWAIGDTFSHALTFPAAENLGIIGWFILLHKVGEYVDAHGEYRQLMCVSICPPDSIPSSYDDLQKLGILPMMQSGGKYEYLAQIVIKSKRGENSYDLTKIGCFTKDNETLLDDYNENPLTAMPLFGTLKRNDLWPAYEDLICRLYRRFGRTV